MLYVCVEEHKEIIGSVPQLVDWPVMNCTILFN